MSSVANVRAGGRSRKRVCVIGAGVIGLSTALRILEEQPLLGGSSQEVEVTVLADRFSPFTTSDGSGGFWEPYNLGKTPLESIWKWSVATWDHMHGLANSELAAVVGAQFVSGFTLACTNTIQEPFFKDIVIGFRHLTSRELSRFPSAKSGYFHTSLQINTQWYLPWLLERIKQLGGRTEVRTIQNVSEVADDYDVLVNCCGPRAGTLVSDTQTMPIRGQVKRIRAPWVKHFYLFDRGDDDIVYILPLGDTVVVGGVAQVGSWKEEVDAGDSQDIWSRATAGFPFIKKAQTVSEWAGLRPGRSMVRLEAEQVHINGKTVNVVHNYGHGGAGVTLHWGCAGEASRLVNRALLQAPPSKL